MWRNVRMLTLRRQKPPVLASPVTHISTVRSRWKLHIPRLPWDWFSSTALKAPVAVLSFTWYVHVDKFPTPPQLWGWETTIQEPKSCSSIKISSTAEVKQLAPTFVWALSDGQTNSFARVTNSKFVRQDKSLVMAAGVGTMSNHPTMVTKGRETLIKNNDKDLTRFIIQPEAFFQWRS